MRFFYALTWVERGACVKAYGKSWRYNVYDVFCMIVTMKRGGGNKTGTANEETARIGHDLYRGLSDIVPPVSSYTS